MQPIPRVIHQFLEAKNGHDAEALAQCFHHEGSVYDEGKVHGGRDAVQRWALGVFDAYTLRSDLIDAEVTPKSVRLWTLVSGAFPGSPLRFVNDFEIQDGLIVSYRTRVDDRPGDPTP